MSPVVAPLAEGQVQRDRTLARLSFAFLLDEVTTGVGGLEPIDALLMLAINQANIAPLTRDPDARARYGQLDAPAPDAERRPVSVNSIAASLGLPFETVRRRIKRLIAVGVCSTVPEGVIVPASFLVSPAYRQSVLVGHERMRGFYLELRGAGLVEALPPPAYSLEPAVPVRAAVRLLSDYVLRTSEGLMREAGNVVSALVLLALLAEALARDEGRRPISVRALAERLRLPAETVRRHVAGLAEDGQCVRTPAGLVVGEAQLARPGIQLLLADNATHVQRLLAGLAERAVILAWENPASDNRVSA